MGLPNNRGRGGDDKATGWTLDFAHLDARCVGGTLQLLLGGAHDSAFGAFGAQLKQSRTLSSVTTYFPSSSTA